MSVSHLPSFTSSYADHLTHLAYDLRSSFDLTVHIYAICRSSCRPVLESPGIRTVLPLHTAAAIGFSIDSPLIQFCVVRFFFDVRSPEAWDGGDWCAQQAPDSKGGGKAARSALGCDVSITQK